MPTIEQVSPRVRTVTIVGRDGVYYSAEHLVRGGAFGEKPEWVTFWEETIPFGRTKYRRPGGVVFQEAARRQQLKAEEEAKAV